MNSFHTIDFKEGLNLIVGIQKSSDTRNTYNGVGKSLIIYLIHFCLGSNNNKMFEEKIPGWEFRLDFEIDGKPFWSTRNTSKQNDIYLNGEKKSKEKFRAELLPNVFNLNEKKNNLSFNTLFPRFIRRDRECYVSYDSFVKKEQEYQKLLNNIFLLGLDINTLQSKKNLREEFVKTEDAIKKMEALATIKDFSNEDTEIKILDIQETIANLENDISNFEVAENYQTIEKDANDVKYKIKSLENERTIINNNIKNINKSLSINPDISINTVINLYKEAEKKIPEMVLNDINKSVQFHEELINSRKTRLQNELSKKQQQLAEVEEVIFEYGLKVNEFLKYLDTHRALDEYIVLNIKLQDLRIQYTKLTEYQELIKKYKKELRTIQNNLTIQQNFTDDYLDSIDTLLNSIMNTFRDLSKQFYDKPGGIKIVNNVGANKNRYDITVKIQDDSSDGVNEVKIFCYDMTMLLLQLNHRMKFLFHDSRLYSNMDPRQRYTLFKVAEQKAKENNMQYICTVNEDTLLSFKEMMKNEEYQKLIEDNIILELTDESDESKLLGLQIDMEYEK